MTEDMLKKLNISKEGLQGISRDQAMVMIDAMYDGLEAAANTEHEKISYRMSRKVAVAVVEAMREMRAAEVPLMLAIQLVAGGMGMASVQAIAPAMDTRMHPAILKIGRNLGLPCKEGQAMDVASYIYKAAFEANLLNVVGHMMTGTSGLPFVIDREHDK